MENLFNRFYQEYKGTPLSLLITSGGISLLSAFNRPGSSAFFYDAIILYSLDSIKKNIVFYNRNEESEIGKCSKLATEIYYRHINTNDSVTKIVINAALTSNRYRKGNNRCHCIINGDYYYWEFPKLSESEHESKFFDKRIHEDNGITIRIINLLLEKYNNGMS